MCWFKGDLWVFTFVTGWQHHLSQSLQSQKSYQVRSLHKKIPLKIQKNCIFLYEILCRFFCYTFFVTLYCTHSKWADATIKHTVLKCSPFKKKKNKSFESLYRSSSATFDVFFSVEKKSNIAVYHYCWLLVLWQNNTFNAHAVKINYIMW